MSKKRIYIIISLALISIIIWSFYFRVSLKVNFNVAGLEQTSILAMKPCLLSGGKWLLDFNECEGGLNKESCEKIGGKFDECASACRNSPGQKICTLQCQIVCKFNP